MSRHYEDDRAAFRPPADWQPPYPAHSSRFGENVDNPVIAYFGCQAGEADSLQEHVSRLSGFLTGGPAPDYCDRAHFVDDDGYANEVFIGYWLKGSDHQLWLQSSGFPEWLVAQGMIPNDVGLWFEPINVTLSRLETIAGKPDYGLARAADNRGTETPDHAYFGSMRVRIASATEEADDLPSRAPPIDRVANTRGRIVRIRPPANLAIIRSGQDWSRCEGDELATYLGEVEPKLADGMKFLREFPEEVGCLSCRYMIERRADGGDDAVSFGHAVFASLGCLEAWAREHPTHLAIFDSFHRMIRKHKDARGLRLWHEVCVLDHQNPDFIYVNCTERTGLLRWFPEAGT